MGRAGGRKKSTVMFQTGKCGEAPCNIAALGSSCLPTILLGCYSRRQESLPYSLRSLSLITPYNILRGRAPVTRDVPLCHQTSMTYLKCFQHAPEMKQISWMRGFFNEQGSVWVSHLWWLFHSQFPISVFRPPESLHCWVYSFTLWVLLPFPLAEEETGPERWGQTAGKGRSWHLNPGGSFPVESRCGGRWF